MNRLFSIAITASLSTCAVQSTPNEGNSNDVTPPRDVVVVEKRHQFERFYLSGSQQLAVRLPVRPSAREYWVLTDGEDSLAPIGTTRFEPQETQGFSTSGYSWNNYRPIFSGETTVTFNKFLGGKTDMAVDALTITLIAEDPSATRAGEEPLGYSYEEWARKHNVPTPRTTRSLCNYGPSAVNLCANGACTPIKDQRTCGSCWAFAGAGAFENTMQRSDWVARDISEQHVISCDTSVPYCDGTTNFADAFQPFYDGAVYESDFPYSAGTLPDGGPTIACPGQFPHHEAIANWGHTLWPDSSCVKAQLASGQFVITFVDATNWWDSGGKYQGGVFSGHLVTVANHVVMLVGYDDTQGVWIVRNSWGEDWGETENGTPRSGTRGGGYMRLAYGTAAAATDTAYITYNANTNLKSAVVWSALQQ